MIKLLLPLLPPAPAHPALAVCLAGAALGAALWLTAGRWSRSIITLCTVALGAYVGVRLPEWFGWSIDGMGTCFGGAMLLGFTGYVLHRFWVGVGLGSVLACWAALADWMIQGSGHWSWPAWNSVGASAAMVAGSVAGNTAGGVANSLAATSSSAAGAAGVNASLSASADAAGGSSTTLPQYLSTLWHQTPAPMTEVLPYACGAALILGIVIVHLWPRLGTASLWASAGVTLLIGMGVAAVEYASPNTLARVNPRPDEEAAAMIALLAIGLFVQWKIIPHSAGEEGDKADDDDAVMLKFDKRGQSHSPAR
jgi:hypothetical protein